MVVNCCLGEMSQIAMRLKFPLDLHNHHIGGAVVLLLLLPHNRNKGGGVCVGLVVNGLQFFVILLF
jgi:hypothetical protein